MKVFSITICDTKINLKNSNTNAYIYLSLAFFGRWIHLQHVLVLLLLFWGVWNARMSISLDDVQPGRSAMEYVKRHGKNKQFFNAFSLTPMIQTPDIYVRYPWVFAIFLQNHILKVFFNGLSFYRSVIC